MKNENSDRRITKGMLLLYLLLALGVGTAIVVGIVKIQFVQGDLWRAMAEGREKGLRTDPARRGDIYSSDGKILATTVTECDLYLDLLDTVVYENGAPKVDKKGNVVTSGPIVDSSFTKYIDTVCQLLHKAFPNHSASYYYKSIMDERSKNDRIAQDKDGRPKKQKARRCFLVQRSVPYSVWLEISRLKGWRSGVVKQVDKQSVVRQVRAHIYGDLASNTIGFRNDRKAGTYSGLEGYYDSILRGCDGLLSCRRLTKGIWLPDEATAGKEVPQRTDVDKVDTLVLQKKVDGQSIVSTIDTRYQDIAESSLRKALRQYGGRAGCAILMEMETGYVLACANLAVDTSQHDYREVRDRNVAVSDVIEPGSTFKTVALMAMLTDPELQIDTAASYSAWHKDFGGKGGAVQDDHAVRDSAGAIRQTLNVREIIEQSSNVGMADMGMVHYGDRRDRLRSRMLEIFPYEKLNPDVVAPQARTYIHEDMRPNSNFTRLCFGYSTRVSPLQIVTFYNALAAGGRMVKPQFCRGYMHGDRLVENKPVVLNPSICSRQQAQMMRTMLEKVVEHGTGNNIKNNTYGIAGKTGTAYHSYANVRRYNASFAGFFPSENPRYTCYVLLEDVPSFGRQAALVFKAISDCVVAVDKSLSDGGVKSVWPKLQEDSTKAQQRPVVEKGEQKGLARAYKMLKLSYQSADADSRWVYYQAANDSLPASYVPYAPAEGRVPNCYGMTAKDAVGLLESQGYRVKVRGYGRVNSQLPKGGTTAKARSTVVLNMK